MSGTVHGCDTLHADVDVSCDVVVIGSGAGGAVLAAGLVERGLKVVMLEEGPANPSSTFDLREATMFPRLYQDRGTRSTADTAIAILQGRTLGGSTVINWTTCFRTPPRILGIWNQVHKLEGLDEASLAPHFDAIEARLSIAEWPVEGVNENNRNLLVGATRLGWEVAPLRRNVKGCANSGYCGVGCVIDAKQSMLVTFVPDAVAGGMDVYADTKAVRIETTGDQASVVHAVQLDSRTGKPTGIQITVRPKGVAVCGGAINSPALLLRSGILDGQVGTRTWLHPVVAMPARYAREIRGWQGAPQSVASHHFVDRGPDKVGYFIESSPLQPMLASTAFVGWGKAKQDLLADLPHFASLIALGVDGILPGDLGGTVSLRGDGRIRVDYAISPALVEAMRDAHDKMARIALAAGCDYATSLHADAVQVRSEADLPALAAKPYGALEHPIFTAHQMGGCVMGVDPATSVVDADMRHHRVKNLFVVDGSALPTALGVNPSETIYGLSHRACDRVASAI